MEELAGIVISKLRLEDGPGGISVLQTPPQHGTGLLVTPVVTDGRVSFDVRVSHHVQDFANAEGFNFPSVEAAAAFIAEHARLVYKKHEKAYLRFVPTAKPQDGIPHLSVDLDADKNIALTNVLQTVVSMRPLRHGLSDASDS